MICAVNESSALELSSCADGRHATSDCRSATPSASDRLTCKPRAAATTLEAVHRSCHGALLSIHGGAHMLLMRRASRLRDLMERVHRISESDTFDEIQSKSETRGFRARRRVCVRSRRRSSEKTNALTPL